jgi:hypothetical protein
VTSLGTGEIVLGAAFALVTLAASAYAGLVLVERLAPDLRGAIRASTLFIAGFGALCAAELIPGALGVLSRETVLVAALAIAAAAHALLRAPRSIADPHGGEKAPHVDDRASRASWVLAGGSLVALAGWALAAASGQVLNPITGTDVATFDLPMISRWIDSGSFWAYNEFVPLVSHGSYPHTVDLGMLSLVLPWESDFAARIPAYAALPFAGVAIVALARELGAPLTSAVVCACAALATPILTFPLFQLAMPDVFIFPTFVGACALLARHCRDESAGTLLLAGLGLGLAFGSKWYGVPIVAAAIAAWLGARALHRRNPDALRALARQLGILTALIVLAGGFWLVRNAVSYDDPVFSPVSTEPLGQAAVDEAANPLRDLTEDALVNAATDPGRLWDLVRGPLFDAFDVGGLLFAAAAIGALALGLRRRREDEAAGLLLAGGGALGFLLVIAYALTPYTAGSELAFVNARYGVAAVLVGAACAAALAASGPRLRIAIESAAAVALLFALGGHPLGLSGSRVGAWVAIAAVLLIALLEVRRRGVRIPRARLLLGASAAAAALAFVAALVVIENRYSENRLAQDPTFTWVIENAPAEQRIGVAGTWDRLGPPPFLAVLGPEFGNHVEFVGEVREDGYLHEIETRRGWRRAVDAAGLDLLLVGTRPAFEGMPRRWARGLGAPLVASSKRFELYDLRRAG